MVILKIAKKNMHVYKCRNNKQLWDYCKAIFLSIWLSEKPCTIAQINQLLYVIVLFGSFWYDLICLEIDMEPSIWPKVEELEMEMLSICWTGFCSSANCSETGKVWAFMVYDESLSIILSGFEFVYLNYILLCLLH